MDAMTQMEVFALIGEINDFADRSESLINRTRTSYEQNKRTVSCQYILYRQCRRFKITYRKFQRNQ